MNGAVEKRLEQSVHRVLEVGGSFIAKNELLMKNRRQILVKTKTKNGNDLYEEFRLFMKQEGERDKKRLCRRGRKHSFKHACEKGQVKVAVVLYVLNVQVCVGNRVG